MTKNRNRVKFTVLLVQLTITDPTTCCTSWTAGEGYFSMVFSGRLLKLVWGFFCGFFCLLFLGGGDCVWFGGFLVCLICLFVFLLLRSNSIYTFSHRLVKGKRESAMLQLSF